MFRRLRVRGDRGEVLLNGIRSAAIVRDWTVTKADQTWTLVGTVERMDRLSIRYQPLMFTAPHYHGFWSWPVQSITVDGKRVTANLGPPEQ